MGGSLDFKKAHRIQASCRLFWSGLCDEKRPQLELWALLDYQYQAFSQPFQNGLYDGTALILLLNSLAPPENLKSPASCQLSWNGLYDGTESLLPILTPNQYSDPTEAIIPYFTLKSYPNSFSLI